MTENCQNIPINGSFKLLQYWHIASSKMPFNKIKRYNSRITKVNNSKMSIWSLILKKSVEAQENDIKNYLVSNMLSQGMDFQCHMLWSFCVQRVNVRGACSFCWYWWNCWQSLLKLSFYNFAVYINMTSYQHTFL